MKKKKELWKFKEKREYQQYFDCLMKILGKEIKKFQLPAVSLIDTEGANPFMILISTIISLRTKDSVTVKASKRLFQKAKTPFEILKLDEKEIEKLIYPCGFYRVKAKRIKEISKILINKYKGKVPDNLDELLSLPGVGRKTANLVISVGFKKQGLCVDTHVHRISNRLGIVDSKTPEQTEMILREILPLKYWEKYNEYLVAYGQNLCKPVKPNCLNCKIAFLCKKNI